MVPIFVALPACALLYRDRCVMSPNRLLLMSEEQTWKKCARGDVGYLAGLSHNPPAWLIDFKEICHAHFWYKYT